LETFKNTTGFSPKESKNKQIISATRIPTPLGQMLAGATEEGICVLEFTDRRMLETQIGRLQKYLQAELIPGNSKYFELLSNELNEYFEGKRKDFTVPLVVPGSDFQQKVWNVLKEIPYGKTRSYKEQAYCHGQSKSHPRGSQSQWRQQNCDNHPLPQGNRVNGRTRWIWRRCLEKAMDAGIGKN
jgi:O6-methylguanine-DNA--protein-cysteine methyltransferase